MQNIGKISVLVACLANACGVSAASLALASTSTSTVNECQGSPTPAPAAVLYAPTMPQPSAVNDLVGIAIQNTNAAVSTWQYITFGQVFVVDQLNATDQLTAITSGGAAIAVQMDVLATWQDGSVKLAALTLKAPSLCASSQLPVMLAKSAAVASDAAVSLHTANPRLTVAINFTSGSYSGAQVVDLGTALQKKLATKPDYWLRGPLVTQGRVDVPLPGDQAGSTSTLHITADVSVFADGSAIADVQFNNDLTTVLPQNGKVNPKGPLAPIEYTATVNFQGKQVSQTVSQVQYTNWHVMVWSGTAQQFNVQHDIEQLERSGAVLPYDLTTGVNNSLLQNYEKNILAKSGFGLPLAGNGVTAYMPMTGGRADIGYTTQYNTVWLMTQDARAAQVALAQSDTSGAVPWNYKLANGLWLTPNEYPKVWIDGRGGPHGYNDGIANTASSAVWTPDNAHQPNLNYVPYLMSASRWRLDRLNAQAAFNLTNSWPGYRCKTAKCNTLLNASDQLRGQAWGFRELKQAAFIGKTGSVEVTNFAQAVSDNWAYLQTQMPIWGSKQGEATGWIPGDYGNTGATAEWQQDFMTTIAVMAFLMGDGEARKFVAWQQPWLGGRFLGASMNPRDGCNYNLIVKDVATGTYLNTWLAIESATTQANISNGNGWSQSNGYYCALARSALNGALIVNPTGKVMQQALSWLEQAGAPAIDQASFRNDPTFNVVRPKPN